MSYDVVIVDECGTEQVFESGFKTWEGAEIGAEKIREEYVEFRRVFVERNLMEVAEENQRKLYDMYDD